MKKIITYGDIEIEKHKFPHIENLILLEDIDFDKILISITVSSGEKIYKYFIGYKDNDNKIKPSHRMLLKTSAHVRSYDGETKWMNFFIQDDELLKKYNDI